MPANINSIVILVLKEVSLEREAKPFGLQRRKRICWSPKPGPKMITLTFYKRKEVYLGEQMLPKQLKFYYVISIVYLNFCFCVLSWSY